MKKINKIENFFNCVALAGCIYLLGRATIEIILSMLQDRQRSSFFTSQRASYSPHYWLAYFDMVASLFCMLYCFFACFFCLFFSLLRAINSCRTVIFCQYLILFHSDFLQSCNYFYFFATMFISCQLLIVCIFATMLSTVHKNT